MKVDPGRLRRLLAAGLLVFAAALVPVATVGRTAVPVPAGIGLALALALPLLLQRDGPPDPRRDPWAAGLLGLGAAAVHLAPGMVMGHDTLDHAWGAWSYLQSWHAGDWLPIWLHQVGLGQPMPLFYGPLPFWAMAPFAIAGGATSWMLSGSFAAAAVCAALTSWLAVARWTNSRRGALVAALAMAWAPYRLLNSNYRLGLGETWGMSFLPLAIFAFERLLTNGSRRRFALAAFATALVALSHTLSLALLAVGILLLVALRLATSAARPAEALLGAGRSLLAGVAGLALAGYFIVPLVAEIGFLGLGSQVGAQGRTDYVAQGLQPVDLLLRRLWDKMLFSHSDDPFSDPKLPLYFGLVLLGGLFCAAVGGRRLARPGSPQRELALLGLASLALTLAPVVAWTARVPGLAILQFPWRFLGPASAAAALTMGCLAAAAPDRRWLPRGGAAIALALAVLLDAFPYGGAVNHVRPWISLAAVSKFWTGEQRAIEVPRPWPLRVWSPSILPPNRCCADVGLSFHVYREYFTSPALDLAQHLARSSVALKVQRGATRRWMVRVDALPYARGIQPAKGAVIPLRYRRGGGTVEVELPRGHVAQVEVAEEYFPGWQVGSDGRWSEVVPSPDGLLTARVPPGRHRLRFRFDRWRWDRALGILMSATTAIGLAAMVLAERRSAATAP